MAKEYLDMTNFETGETVKIKIGVNWPLLFAPFLFLIPLFHYKFTKIAKWFIFSLVVELILFITAMASYMQIYYVSLLDEVLISIITFYNVALCYLFFYLFIRGNKMIADMYYEKGFLAINTDMDMIKRLRSDWGLPEAAFLTLRNKNDEQGS